MIKLLLPARFGHAGNLAEIRKLAFGNTPHDPDDNKECTTIRKGLKRAVDSLCEKRFVFNRSNRLHLTNVEEVTSDEFAWAE